MCFVLSAAPLQLGVIVNAVAWKWQAGECAVPVIDLLMKAQESGQLVWYRYCHVVFDRVQSTQHQVEYTHGISKLVRKLLNDYSKAAKTHIKVSSLINLVAKTSKMQPALPSIAATQCSDAPAADLI